MTPRSQSIPASRLHRRFDTNLLLRLPRGRCREGKALSSSTTTEVRKTTLDTPRNRRESKGHRKYTSKSARPLQSGPATTDSPKSQRDSPGTYSYGVSSVRYWPSRDPIGERGGTNLYGFVFNSPLQWLDWLGGRPIPMGIDVDAWTRQQQKLRDQIHRKRNKKGGGMDKVQDTFPTSSEEDDSDSQSGSATFTFYLIDESKPANEAECKKGDVDFEATASTNLPRLIEPSTSTASTLLQIAGALNDTIGKLSNLPPAKALDAVDNTQNIVTGLQTMLTSTGVLFEISISARYRCCKCRYSTGGPDWHWSEYKSLGPVKVQSELTGDLWGTRPEMAGGMVKAMQDTIGNLRAKANEACNPSPSGTP